MTETRRTGGRAPRRWLWAVLVLGSHPCAWRTARADSDAGPSDAGAAVTFDADQVDASLGASEDAQHAGEGGAPAAAAPVSGSDAAMLDGAPGGEAFTAVDGGQDAGAAVVGAPVLAPAAVDPPAPAPSAAQPSAPAVAPVEVTVQGQLSARAQLEKSSAAVTVVNLTQAKKRSSDLGEVLARVAGVSVRRYGGLGSEYRFSLNGLYDDQIRFFVDGVPVDRVYAMKVAYVPINLIDDVEVYRGVVPLRFGADTLGGAVNLVTPAKYETMAQATYQVGSFGTHRATVAGRYRHEPSGFVAGIDAFLDYADNDYKIDVNVPDERGRLAPARVRRFHDAYRARGVFAEAGVVDKPWARKLLVRGFSSWYRKQLQNNVVMTVPYGETFYGDGLYGGLAEYQNDFKRRYSLAVIASYSYRTIDFDDKSRWVYDWYGERIRERRVPGEIEDKPHDQTVWQHGAFGRATLDVRLAPGHTLSVSATPDFATRTGDERMQLDPQARDPLSADRDLFKLVSGVSYMLHLAPLSRAPAEAEARRPEHYRVENVLFAKSYMYRANSQEALPGNIFRRRDRETALFGGGDTLRVTLVDDYLLVKASYEYATHLPEVWQVFGNGVLILANLELTPETGHNANFGPQLDLRKTKAGDFWWDVNFFFRDTRDQIVLLGNDRFFAYQNVYRARSTGIENMLRWTSPGRYVNLDAQVTHMELRNVSDHGTFGDFEGDRIPNRPWLFASWGGFLRFDRVLWKRDRIEPFYQGRYVREFFRGWESVGLREFKQTVPTQVSHDLGLTYSVRPGRTILYGTLEVQNITDAKLYDTFGVQRPGRAYYFKLVGEL